MRKLKALLLLLFGLLLSHAGEAQSRSPQDSLKLTGNAFSVGIGATNYGWGVDMAWRKRLSETQDLFIRAGLYSFRSHHEHRIMSFYQDQGGKKYLFDKLNYCYQITPIVGLSRVVMPRSAHNHVELRAQAGAGPVLALLKPYYLEVAVPLTTTTAILEIQAYDPGRHNYYNIYGAGDYMKGFDQLRLQPGARVTAGLALDFTGSPMYIRSLELNAFADYFPKPLQIMGHAENPRFYLGGALAFMMGNVW